MAILTVTARGQVTLRKEILRHLGIKPGDKIEFDLLPDKMGVVKVAQPTGDINDFIGLLKDKDRDARSIPTIEELNEAASQGWMGQE